MNSQRFCSALVVLVAILILHDQGYAGDLSRTTIRASIGAVNTREDPVNLANLGEELSKLHLAGGGMFAIDFLSKKNLSLALDCEVWATAGSFRGADLTTVPILAGMYAALFPSSPVRLYGTGSAGICIMKLTKVSDWQIMHPLFPIPYRESSEEVGVSFAYAAGGGVEFVSARSKRLFSIDYRYWIAGSDASLGGHLLCVSYGFRF